MTGATGTVIWRDYLFAGGEMIGLRRGAAGSSTTGGSANVFDIGKGYELYQTGRIGPSQSQ